MARADARPAVTLPAGAQDHGIEPGRGLVAGTLAGCPWRLAWRVSLPGGKQAVKTVPL